MTAIAIGGFAPVRRKLIAPSSPWIPTKFGIEVARDCLERADMGIVDRFFRLKGLRDLAHFMAGSDGLWLSQQLAGNVDGGAATSGIPSSAQNWQIGLWTATIDGTMTGATASEAAYTSYARLALLNSTTIFPTGTTVSTEQNQNKWPGDAVKSWPASTGSTATVTWMAKLNGNAGTTADKCGAYCSVTSTVINSGDTPQLAQNAVTQTRD